MEGDKFERGALFFGPLAFLAMESHEGEIPSATVILRRPYGAARVYRLLSRR